MSFTRIIIKITATAKIINSGRPGDFKMFHFGLPVDFAKLITIVR
jgi:hypothetical protein